MIRHLGSLGIFSLAAAYLTYRIIVSLRTGVANYRGGSVSVDENSGGYIIIIMVQGIFALVGYVGVYFTLSDWH